MYLARIQHVLFHKLFIIFSFLSLFIPRVYTCMYMHVYMCVCVCVCIDFSVILYFSALDFLRYCPSELGTYQL